MWGFIFGFVACLVILSTITPGSASNILAKCAKLRSDLWSWIKGLFNKS